MSDAAAAPVAPAPSAPAAPSAPSTGAPASPPPAASPNAPQAAGGQQTPPPAERQPVPWKTKARVGDAEHELELDVSPFLESYKRKLKLDGEEVEVSLEDAFKGYERAKPSYKRFEEAAQMRREVEAERAKLKQQIETIEGHLADPVRAVPIMQQALGPKYVSAVLGDLRQRVNAGDAEAINGLVDIVEERQAYLQLSPEDRARRDRMTEAERRAAEREAAIAAREREIAERDRRAREAEERRIEQIKHERIQALTAEIVPQLDALGVPVKLDDGNVDYTWVQEVGRIMRHAQENQIPKTLSEAVREVGERYKRMVSHALQRQQQSQMQAIQEQPGRAAPSAPKDPPRAANGRFQSREPESLEEIRARLRAAYQR